MGTQATIIVKFGDQVSNAEDYFVTAIIDEQLDASGSVKTSYNPGDQPSVLIQHDGRVRIGSVKCSTGQMVYDGQVSRNKETTLVFTEQNEEKQLSYIARSLSMIWYGHVATYRESEDRKLVCSGGQLPAICRASLSCGFHKYDLHANIPPLTPEDEYPVAIVVYMEVI